MSDMLQHFHREHKQAVRRIDARAVSDPGIDLKRMPKGFQFQVHKGAMPVPEQRIVFIIDEAAMQAEVLHRLTIPIIIRRVAEAYGTTSLELKGPCRTAAIVRIRHIAMYLVKEISKKSLPETGRRFNRDHTSILHGVRKVQHQILKDAAYAQEVAELEARILSRNRE